MLESFAQAWELKKKEDSIEVYTRTTANSSIKEFKVVGIVKASSQNILETIRDVSAYPSWIEDVNNTKTIIEEGDRLSFYYQVDLPWPFKDRDLVMDMSISQRDNLSTVTLTNNPGLVALDKNFIRMTEAEGEWLISEIDISKCAVEYRFLADPAGSIPAWVINLFIVEGPFKTMQNLRTKVKEG